MKIKARFQVPRVNLSSYKGELANNFSDLITYAAIQWIEAAISQIPVWSGASHATFLHLAREAGFQLSIQEQPNAPRRVNLGLRTSEGDIEIHADRGEFSFEYETRLRHLVINEYTRATQETDSSLFSELKTPGPYNFQKFARDAAIRVIMGGKLPDILQHMAIKNIRSG